MKIYILQPRINNLINLPKRDSVRTSSPLRSDECRTYPSASTTKEPENNLTLDQKQNYQVATLIQIVSFFAFMGIWKKRLSKKFNEC